MADYIYKTDTQSTFNAEEEARFRKLMDKWADSIKEYKGKKFGNTLKILKVLDTPYYLSTIKYQNDTRTTEYHKEKYNNQILEPCTIFNESDFNRWNVCPAPTPFSENTASFFVKGSRQVKKCETCGGSGKTDCPECNGYGTLTCSKCNGNKTVEVKKEIKKECGHCKGKGEWYEYYEVIDPFTKKKCTEQRYAFCTFCSRTGYTIETKYKTETCDHCNGTGDVTCKNCHGSGYIICQTCGGNGKALYMWLVHQKTFVKSDREFALTDSLTDKEKFKFTRIFDRTDGKVVFSQKSNSSNVNFEELKRQGWVSNSLLKLVENIKDSQENHITYYELVTNEYLSKTVRYEVDGKEYSCMLLGDSWDVFSIKSPISDFMDELKKKVVELSSKREYGKAWKLMKRVMNLPQAGKKEEQALSVLESTLKATALYGKLFAVLLFLGAIIPLLKLAFLNPDYMPLAPWTHWLDGILHMHHTGDVFFYLLLDLIIMKFFPMPGFVYKRENSVVRLISGFLYGIVTQALIFAIFFALDWLGIVTLFEWASYWILMGVYYVLWFIIIAIVFVIDLIIELFRWIF